MSQQSRRGAGARGAGLVALGMTVMNAAAYLFTLVAARGLGPAEYSAVAALMGVVLVANVIALGVQATTARRIAVAGRGGCAGPIMTAGRRAAWVLAGACLLLSPVANALFRLGSWTAAATVAVTAGALTITGVRLGIAQGRRQWREFAILSVASGLGRVLVGGAVLWAWPSALGAMSGVALGALVPVVIGRWLVPGPTDQDSGRESWPVVVREVLHDSQTLLAFFVLTQADVFIARAILPTQESGLYAAGLIVAKTVLFLPTFVTVLAYPALARRRGGRHLHHRGLLVVFGIGFVAVVLALLLPGFALVFVGGPAYSAVRGDLWLFALLGTVTAMIQLLVQTALARRQRSAGEWLWVALALVILGMPFVEDGRALVLLVLGIDIALFLALLVVTWSEDPTEPADADKALAEALSRSEGQDASHSEDPEPLPADHTGARPQDQEALRASAEADDAREVSGQRRARNAPPRR